ncbi:MAG TPA: DUF5591 domain-containing protein [Candidatus Methanoperedens sp.]
MKLQKLTGGYELLWHPDVISFYNYLLEEYEVPNDKKIALFLPCAATKPYSQSRTHKKVIETIQKSCGSQKYLIHELIISEPLGIVPRELEKKYPAAHYDMVLDTWFPINEIQEIRKTDYNDIFGIRKNSKEEYRLKRKIVNILSERVAKYLLKTKNNYNYYIGYVRSTHKEILEIAGKIANIDVDFILNKELVKRISSEKGRFYWIMNGLRCEESLSELDNRLKIKQ